MSALSLSLVFFLQYHAILSAFQRAYVRIYIVCVCVRACIVRFIFWMNHPKNAHKHLCVFFCLLLFFFTLNFIQRLCVLLCTFNVHIHRKIAYFLYRSLDLTHSSNEFILWMRPIIAPINTTCACPIAQNDNEKIVSFDHFYAFARPEMSLSLHKMVTKEHFMSFSLSFFHKIKFNGERLFILLIFF